MSATGSAATRQPHPFWVWLKRRPLEALPMVGFLIALASFVMVAVPAVARGDGEALVADIVAHSYVLTWMLVATTTVRTVGLRQVMTMFLSGFFLSTVLAIALTRPLIDWFGSNDFTIAFWVPLIEELAKLIPLLLLLWAYHRRRGQAHGISDLVVMGFAVGAGMAVHEDIRYGRAIVSFDGDVLGAFTEPWGALFPTFHWGFSGLTTGHSGWGAAIALGVALASVYLRRRILAICFVVAGLLIAVVDHSSMNAQGDFSVVLSALSLDHGAAIVTLIVGFPLAIAYDVFRRRHRPPPLPAPNLKLYRAALSPREGGWRVILNFLALGHYRRGWTAAAYSRSAAGSRGDDHARLLAWYRVIVPTDAPESDPALRSRNDQA